MLTRKSLVRPGHRGERPIEFASCWFPPKFLSGKRSSSWSSERPYVNDGARVGFESARNVEIGRPRRARRLVGKVLVSRFCKAD